MGKGGFLTNYDGIGVVDSVNIFVVGVVYILLVI
jgi:hypothetical protein